MFRLFSSFKIPLKFVIILKQIKEREREREKERETCQNTKLDTKRPQGIGADQNLVTDARVLIGTHIFIPAKCEFWHVLLA